MLRGGISDFVAGRISNDVAKSPQGGFPGGRPGDQIFAATKAVPKEVLPLVDRPLIQYAIDEAREAGVTDFIFVTAKGKSALENYFDGAPDLVRSLKAKGKTDLLAAIEPQTWRQARSAIIVNKKRLVLATPFGALGV